MNPVPSLPKTDRIRVLNDSLRSTFTGGQVVMTPGVAALPENELAQLLERVRRFDEFTKDNDPHGEHDFGSFQLAGQTYFFKVDYDAPDMEGGSEDPADPEKTTRVLTITPTSTEPQWKETCDRRTATCVSCVHRCEARRTRRVLAPDRRRLQAFGRWL